MVVPKRTLSFLVQYRERLLERGFIWGMFGDIEERSTVHMEPAGFDALVKSGEAELSQIPERKEENQDETVPGDVITVTRGTSKDAKTVLCGVTGSEDKMEEAQSVVYLSDGPTVLDFQDTFTLEKGMIDNYDGPAVETKVGRYVINQIVLVDSFGSVAPYVNTKTKPSKLEDIAVALLRDEKIDASNIHKFTDNAFFLGSISPLCVTTATEKSFRTDPDIEKKKNALLEKYKGQLNDPLKAKEFEDELLAIDQEFLGDDSSRDFYDAMGSKAYELHRKKMFLTAGGIPAFSTDASDYEFIENSFAEGWDTKDFPAIANEIRSGSYKRGKATQDGGMLSKYMQRIFQNVEITEDDCGTKRYLEVPIPTDKPELYLDRWIMDGSLIRLTSSNIGKYAGKTVRMRSPMYCQTEYGLCFKCVGELFKTLDQKGLSMVSTRITTTFLNSAMAAMHGTTISTVDIDIDDYIFG